MAMDTHVPASGFLWIPACAGMTEGGTGMTEGGGSDGKGPAGLCPLAGKEPFISIPLPYEKSPFCHSRR